MAGGATFECRLNCRHREGGFQIARAIQGENSHCKNLCSMSGNIRPATSGDSRSLLSNTSLNSTTDYARICGGSRQAPFALGHPAAYAYFKPAVKVGAQATDTMMFADALMLQTL
jgi:hypothetical protein